MANKKRDFKLVLIGDGGVGKSTFVQSLINEDVRQTEQISKHQPIQLPPEMFQNPECNTTLYDTKSEINQLPEEVNRADVILLMYAIDNDGSSQRLKFWLKELRERGFSVPVIIVGNKLDTYKDDDEEREYQRIFKVIKQLFKDYNSVEMGIECSAKQGKGIFDVINCAQRSFLYPLAPIYNLAEKSLTEGFKKALTRIFRICDRDNDGYWSDQELEKFQKKVFKRQLDSSDITGIKDMIEEEIQNNSNRQHITLEGFMALQKRGIELMKIQICWTILRFFRYKDDLTIEESLFTNELIFDQEAGQTVELSDLALNFLKDIFQLRGNQLTQKQVEEIFYPVVIKTNFPHFSQYWPLQQEMNQIQWQAMWNAFAYFNYKEAYKLLCYIGMDIKLSDCFKEQNKKDSWSSVQKNIDRRVFHIAIVTKNKDTKDQLLKQNFNNLSPIITTINNKTYIISLYEQQEAELQIEKRRLSVVDYILIHSDTIFETAQLIPTNYFNDNIPFWNQIKLIAEQLHQQPFGYSEIQIQQLKKQNSLPILELTLWIAIGLGITGGIFYHKKKRLA